jgi:hypothetical protein
MCKIISAHEMSQVLKIYMYIYLPLTFVEHVVDLNKFVIEALSAVDSAGIQCHSA